MSAVMYPFDTAVGVVIRRWPSSRALMLPSFDATYPRAYMRRPTSTISARSCSSVRVVITVGRGLAHTIHRTGLRGSRPELAAALLRTEEMRLAAGGQRQFLPRRHEYPADRIPNELH